MRATLLALFVFVAIAVAAPVNSRNLYQTCTNGGSSYYSSYEPSYYYDFGIGSLPSNNHSYSYHNATTGETVYFNFCAGLDICQGAMACVVSKAGEVYTYTYPYYASSQIYGTQLQFCCQSKNLYIDMYCDSTTQFTITYYEVYSSSLTIYANSQYACSTSGNVAPYAPIADHSNFNAPFYMKGRLTYFLQDYLGNDFDSEFVGHFYYSSSYGIVINGTLSNNNTSHFVSFIYEKQISLNPPRAFSYIKPTSSSPMVCKIQGINDNSDGDFANDIFSEYQNQWMSVERQYTPLYFNKGTSFPVNVYTEDRYETAVTLMTRISDGGVVYAGARLISPWAQYEVGEFISEFNWNSISFATLSKSTFTPPSSWSCGF